jgi:hypothetical protein
MSIDIKQTPKCPKCKESYCWGFEQITTTKERIIAKYGMVGVKEIDAIQVIERKTKYRKFCRNCAYKGTWKNRKMFTDVRPPTRMHRPSDKLDSEGGSPEAESTEARQ